MRQCPETCFFLFESLSIFFCAMSTRPFFSRLSQSLLLSLRETFIAAARNRSKNCVLVSLSFGCVACRVVKVHYSNMALIPSQYGYMHIWPYTSDCTYRRVFEVGEIRFSGQNRLIRFGQKCQNSRRFQIWRRFAPKLSKIIWVFTIETMSRKFEGKFWKWFFRKKYRKLLWLAHGDT